MSKTRELRFAAGSPSLHSRVWKVFATGSEVYLTVRTSGNLFKCSLHSAREGKPPICQLSIPSEFIATNPEAGLPGETRHLARWERAGPDVSGQTLGVRLYLPYEGMRGTELPAKHVRWLGNPMERQAVDIRFVFCPERMASQALAEWGPQWSVFADWPLPNGERFRALTTVVDLSADEDRLLREAIEQSRKRRPYWQSGPIDFSHPDLGYISYGLQDNGMFTLIDWHLSPRSESQDAQPSEAE